MIKHLFILVLSLGSINYFGQVDSNENFSKKKVEKIIKEIRLIYNAYGGESECAYYKDCELYDNTVFISHTPIPGIGSERKSIVWSHASYHNCSGDYFKVIKCFDNEFEYSREEFVKHISEECLFEVENYNSTEKLKYFNDDKMTNGLIFYFKDYNYNSKAVDPEVGSDEYPISKTIRAYYFKNNLIKVIIEDRISKNKETYYHPFMKLKNSILKELQNIKSPEPY